MVHTVLTTNAWRDITICNRQIVVLTPPFFHNLSVCSIQKEEGG